MPTGLDRLPAPALVLAAIVSVQTGSGIARTLFDELGAPGVTFLRLGLAALILIAVVRPPVRTWSLVSWRAAAMLGIVMAGMNLAFYLSLRTVPLGVAVTVEFIGPLLLALAQTRRPVDVLWALLAACGVVLLGSDSSGDIAASGLAFAFAAGLLWACYILASAKVGQVLPGIDGLAVALALGALVTLPMGLDGVTGVIEEPSLLLAAGAVALLSSIFSYGLELTALRRLPTRVFGVLMSLQPAAAALAGLIVLDQALQGREVLALVLVSLASGGITLARRAEQPALQPLE